MAQRISATWDHDGLIHGWWVVPGRLLAGEYPGAMTPEKAARKIQALVDSGVTSIVDLTVAGESTFGGPPLRPYDDALTLRHTRFPIPDNGVVSDAGYDEIVVHIDSELDAGEVVYVHCWGGKGRTGTVVGAWLIDHDGLSFLEVLERLQELREGTRKAHERVPQTPAQDAALRRRAARNGVRP